MSYPETGSVEDFEVEIVDDSEQHVVGQETEPAVDDSTSQDTQGADADAGEQKSPQGKKSRKQKAEERIAELTRKHRDEERKRLQYERQLEQERQQFQQKDQSFQQERQQYAQFLQSELDAQKEMLEERLHEARNRGDSKAEVKIQDRLDSVRYKLGQLRQYAPQKAEKQDQPDQPAQPQQQETQPQQPSQAQVPDAARQWVEQNSFLNARQDMHPVVNGVYQQLAQTQDPADPAFYTELNSRLKQELPEYLSKQLVDPNAADTSDLDTEEDDTEEDDVAEQRREPSQPVAASGRNTQQKPRSKQKVKLTRDEVAIARQLGLTPEQYAKQKAGNQTTNGYTPVGG